MKVVVDDGAGRIVFVRHNYGKRDHWELPGGGVHRDEPAGEAARREAREELGQDIADWRELGVVADGRWHGKHERLACFGARWPGGPVRYDRVEIATVAWFPLESPPSPLGPSTAAALPEVLAHA